MLLGVNKLEVGPSPISAYDDIILKKNTDIRIVWQRKLAIIVDAFIPWCIVLFGQDRNLEGNR